jgi:hypothetical protein
VVYEIIDELDVFPGDKALLQRNHPRLLQETDFVLVTADHLMEQVKQIRPDACLCANAVTRIVLYLPLNKIVALEINQL